MEGYDGNMDDIMRNLPLVYIEGAWIARFTSRQPFPFQHRVVIKVVAIKRFCAIERDFGM
jgi:hypothetical protein